MPPKARKSISDGTGAAAGKPTGASAVYPCFKCGLMFAKKDQFTEHMERYHQPASKVQFRCPDCGQSFGDDEAEYKEHLIVHDMSTILGLLQRSELNKKKKAPPLVVRAPPVETTATSSKNSDAAFWDQEEKSATTETQAATGKSKVLFIFFITWGLN